MLAGAILGSPREVRAEVSQSGAAPAEAESKWHAASRAALERGDERRARGIVEAAVVSGDAEAINVLAVYVEEGIGGAADPVRALELFRKAVSAGSIGAALNLGSRLLDSNEARERERGFALLRALYLPEMSLEKPVKRMTAACLAEAYLFGRGVERDVARGVDLLEEADAFEDASSGTVYLLGRTYESGWGGREPDARKSYAYFRRASEVVDPRAWWKLGMALLSGEAVEVNPEEAYRWVRKAGDAGYVNAEISTAVMLATGEGVAEDDAAACEWYERAARRGSAHALRGLGFMLLTGEGGARDAARGYAYLELAAQAGEPNAKRLLEEPAARVGRRERRKAKALAAEWVREHGAPPHEE